MFDFGAYDKASLADRMSVREVVEFERYCRDYELWDHMESLFLTDSRVRISWFDGTGQEFTEQSKHMAGATHKIHNTIVKVKQARAVAEMIAQIQSRQEVDGVWLDLISDVRLLYRLEKRKEEWKILSIDCIYEKDALVPVIPVSGFYLDTAAMQVYRSSYQCLCMILERKNRIANQNLPGIDRPEMIRHLYKEYEEWLECKREC